MELPLNLKNLYRHWENHAIKIDDLLSFKEVFDDEKLHEDIQWFIKERIDIWKKKIANEKPPLTKDPILSHYRFCNIFREFDRQTIGFHILLNPLRDNFPLWLLNMFYCRMVARTETIQATGLLSFDTKENAKVYKKLMSLPRPKYGTPYVFPVSTILKSETPTRELFITKHLPKVMEKVAEEITTWNKKSVLEGVETLLPTFGFNLHFLWTEVLIDTAYQFPQHINLFAEFPIGPGSLPTFKKINPSVKPTELVTTLSKIPIDVGITYNNKPLRLSAENWEGIGCEFRKYTNLKCGRGRKRIYAPKEKPSRA